MNTRLYNARICTMEKDTSVQFGEIWIVSDKINYVGPYQKCDIIFDREIDIEKNLILPGFKNAHTHSAMTFLRSYADDLPLLDWLHKQVFPMEAKLNAEYAYILSKLAILEYLTSGITANFDMYMFAKDVAKASSDCGFRTVMCGALSNFISNLQQMEEEYNYLNSESSLISATIGFHAEYTCSEELLLGVASIADKYKALVYTHNSESASEVAECVERNGKSPTEYLDSLGLFNYGGGVFHCVHVTDRDLEIFKERQMFVVTNPASNAKLASGIAPLQKMLDMGIPVALGTDGPASNNALDMFREMYLATALQKLARDEAEALDADNVLMMATVTGANAMGLTDCNSLAVGKKADLTVIDLNQPNMQPINNLTKNVVYSGSKKNIKMTMVDGKILYENDQFFIDTDPQEIYQKANEIIQSMR